MLLITISLNLFIVAVMFGLALWGVYVLMFVGGRQAKKTKRPIPAAYTFFQPTAPSVVGSTFSGTVPLSNVNTDELRFGIIDLSGSKPADIPTPPNPTAATQAVQQADDIADDNPDFAVRDDEFGNEPTESDTLARPRQVMVEAVPVPVTGSSPTTALDLTQLTFSDEDILNQVEAIFGNVDQMDLLDQFHTEANRVMLLTGEDYHSVFLRLIQNEPEESRAYLTSMLVPAGTPEPTMSLATVLAMGDEDVIDN